MAYPDSSRTWVQVSTGKVAFFQSGKENEKVVLDPGERGEYLTSQRIKFPKN